MFSSQVFINPLDDLPEEEGPLGLFFSSPEKGNEDIPIGLHLSSPLLSDSLFLRHLSTEPAQDSSFRDAQIYFPDLPDQETDTLYWHVQQPGMPFAQFCKEQAPQADSSLLESIVSQLCEMVHILHLHEAANMPITPQMLRIQSDGTPMLLMLPINEAWELNPTARQAIFPTLFSAPEIENQYSMLSPSYTYNVALLTALLNGFMPDEEASMEEMLAGLQTWIKAMPESALKTVLQQSLQADCQARPYCPMKFHKSLCGSQPYECKNCRAH